MRGMESGGAQGGKKSWEGDWQPAEPDSSLAAQYQGDFSQAGASHSPENLLTCGSRSAGAALGHSHQP